MLEFLDLNVSVIHEEKAAFESKDELAGNDEALRALLVHNANYLIFRALSHLQENVSKAVDQLSGWNDSQVHHLNESAKAFGYLISADLFLASIEKARSDAATYELLHKLYELFVLEKVEKQLYEYRDFDYISWE